MILSFLIEHLLSSMSDLIPNWLPHLRKIAIMSAILNLRITWVHIMQRHGQFMERNDFDRFESFLLDNRVQINIPPIQFYQNNNKKQERIMKKKRFSTREERSPLPGVLSARGTQVPLFSCSKR